jgi:predicted ArsR family transcriptional regulator
MSKTELHRRLGGHVPSDALTKALTRLREAGNAEAQDRADTGGRPAQLWRAVPSGYREETELTKKAST